MAEFSVPSREVVRGYVVWTRGEVVKVGRITGVTNLEKKRYHDSVCRYTAYSE